MKIVKSLIIFSAFLIMASIGADLIIDFNFPSNTEYRHIGGYIGLGAMGVLLFVLILISFTERKLRKLEAKIEEKDQEIGRLQKSLEQTNEVINIVPSKGEDVEM